ncbi:piggyBac transposable element-derived protein 4-like [Mercenaria mercenaria]|uniref:piggyBac transposable element-derived protein 4-like n=1 Tax=Mercenaria mercenaria TaxID=6596 RepID=UPI00234E5E9A|nr:piggyBac transposable element-derived protein 4-like [Mercenaria mercenaria]
MFDDFVGTPGPNLLDGFDRGNARPIDYFWLMFPANLITKLVQYTNSYAVWKMVQNGAVDDKWEEVTEPEMKAYLGINILMGIKELPEVEMYWSTDPFIGNTGIQQVMTCNRFHKITLYFHASNPDTKPRGTPAYDRLYKVHEIISAVSDAFFREYPLCREVSVDEAMIKFSGRLSFRQYMPVNPIKRGMKAWMLCDTKSAYLLKDVYLGRQDTHTAHGLGFNTSRNQEMCATEQTSRFYSMGTLTSLHLFGKTRNWCTISRGLSDPSDVRDAQRRQTWKVIDICDTQTNVEGKRLLLDTSKHGRLETIVKHRQTWERRFMYLTEREGRERENASFWPELKKFWKSVEEKQTEKWRGMEESDSRRVARARAALRDRET